MQCRFFYAKTYRFPCGFPNRSRRGGNLPPAKMRSIFLNLSAFTRNTIAAKPRNKPFGSDCFQGTNASNFRRRHTSFRKEGDRREAVVEDSLSRKRFIICAEGTRILNGLPLILASLHTVAPLVRERLWRSRTLHRSQANGPPLFEERYSLRLNFSVFVF